MSALFWISLSSVFMCWVFAQDISSNKVHSSSEETIESSKSNDTIINKSNSVNNSSECSSLMKPISEYAHHQCKVHKDCKYFGVNLKCCNGKCSKSMHRLRPETKHSALFGIIERKCPLEPIAEFLAVQECKNDQDCGARVCCPELDAQGGGNVSYCRTPMYLFDKIPIAKPFVQPIQNVVSYMQCTPAPPPFLDLFPKPCRTPLDCIPNLCCQERGQRVCRPPRRSLLALLLSMTQRIGFLNRIK